jgi:hypothetical protein
MLNRSEGQTMGPQVLFEGSGFSKWLAVFEIG